jgi:hypothetical protein
MLALIARFASLAELAPRARTAAVTTRKLHFIASGAARR